MQRPVAAAAARAARENEEGAASGASDAPVRPWYDSTMVRVILVMIAVFAVMHFFLWGVVASFIRDMNHERLHEHKPRVWESLQRVIDHL
jgi:hypothetical protein